MLNPNEALNIFTEEKKKGAFQTQNISRKDMKSFLNKIEGEKTTYGGCFQKIERESPFDGDRNEFVVGGGSNFLKYPGWIFVFSSHERMYIKGKSHIQQEKPHAHKGRKVIALVFWSLKGSGHLQTFQRFCRCIFHLLLRINLRFSCIYI